MPLDPASPEQLHAKIAELETALATATRTAVELRVMVAVGQVSKQAAPEPVPIDGQIRGTGRTQQICFAGHWYSLAPRHIKLLRFANGEGRGADGVRICRHMSWTYSGDDNAYTTAKTRISELNKETCNLKGRATLYPVVSIEGGLHWTWSDSEDDIQASA